MIGAADNVFKIYDETDSTKLFAWTLGNQTTGTTLTVNSGAQPASRQLSVPVLAANDTIAVIGQGRSSIMRPCHNGLLRTRRYEEHARHLPFQLARVSFARN